MRYAFTRQQWWGEQGENADVENFVVGLRHLAPVPWVRFKFHYPHVSELALTAESIEDSTADLSAGKSVDDIMVRPLYCKVIQSSPGSAGCNFTQISHRITDKTTAIKVTRALATDSAFCFTCS